MKLLELTVRTLCDIRAGTVTDAAYLYSQTKDNQESVLTAAAKLFRKGLTEKIIIADSDPKSDYPGFSVWKNELLQMGVPKEAIAGVDLRDQHSLNTLIEAEGIIS